MAPLCVVRRLLFALYLVDLAELGCYCRALRGDHSSCALISMWTYRAAPVPLAAADAFVLGASGRMPSSTKRRVRSQSS